ncbi:uncharacterized protein J4E92_002035 [Alternaria infectoria]|uniref:uncharacterized protein n=1 Tax=Alternaria infectoria TaxID=45303 RepID=UPI00221E585C|nr:uncharacterized protein J4E92_002035 [Alternaria infectoria]KAI4937305.1 hypothetical protein J4E92_002035 [Alternaria infectoria]
MAKPQGFLRLPRELRDKIYEDCFTLEDGYHYNHKTNKLLTAQAEVIDFNLRLTCRQVAAETRGLGLSLNPINFSTVCDENLRQRAGRFNAIQIITSQLKAGYLTWHAPLSGLIDSAICDYVAKHHSAFLPTIQTMQYFGRTGISGNVDEWKEIPSQTRQFIASTLEAVAAKPDFEDAVSRESHWKGTAHTPSPDPVLVVAHSHPPWMLPSEDDISDMVELIEPVSVEASYSKPWLYWDQEQYRFSAATAAIHFLESMPAETRLAMRNLVLHEDHESVAWPECHGRGLIPFCQENSDLHIERRISLWRTILPAASMSLCELQSRTLEDVQQWKLDRLTAQMISRGYMDDNGVAAWIMEALALASLGMPAGAFNLVIDGMPTPETSAQIFNVLQRDAAWQSAYQQCVKAPDSQSCQLNWVMIRENAAFIIRGFPEALQEICSGKSMVRCNFDTGFAHDVDQIVAQGRTWTLREWRQNWHSTGRLQADIHTVAPLPSWLEILREKLLSCTGTD